MLHPSILQEPRRALIIGGGIGGLAAAIALRQLGWETTVYERAPELREVGAGLSLWANAIRALDKLGVAEAVRALQPPPATGGIFTWRGRPLLTDSTDALAQRVGEISVVVHRADLLNILNAALDGVTVKLNSTCVNITQDADGVTAQMADGTVARGALLVGADGIHSAVRAQLVGNSAPTYAGYTSYRAITSFDHSRIAFGEYWGCGARLGIAPISGGRVYWFATRNTSPGERFAPADERAALLHQFKDWAEPIPALLAATPAEVILRHDLADRPPLGHWSYGRVTLLGDAAHPMTPNLGQGACQALEDAVVLADALRQNSAVAAALHAYEQQRIPRTTQIVQQSRRIGQIGQWANPFACKLRNTLLRGLAPVQARAIDSVVGYRV